MDTMRDIKIRLNSINSTKQITESMRLVSTSKVQKAKARMEANQQYLAHSIKIINKIASNPLVSRHEYITGRGSGKSLIIVITGDRGLCGGYNINIGREAFALSKKLGDTHVIAIGAKGRDYFRRRNKPALNAFKGLSESPFFEDAQNIGEYALSLFDEKTVEQIFLVSTEYHSILSQSPKTTRLLPLEAGGGVNLKEEDCENESYDCGEVTFLKHAVRTYICATIFGAMLESAVSEQSARIASMDSAQKNSDELMGKLYLLYNQIRQGAITQEVAEVVGGANAVSQME